MQGRVSALSHLQHAGLPRSTRLPRSTVHGVQRGPLRWSHVHLVASLRLFRALRSHLQVRCNENRERNSFARLTQKFAQESFPISLPRASFTPCWVPSPSRDWAEKRRRHHLWTMTRAFSCSFLLRNFKETFRINNSALTNKWVSSNEICSERSAWNADSHDKGRDFFHNYSGSKYFPAFPLFPSLSWSYSVISLISRDLSRNEKCFRGRPEHLRNEKTAEEQQQDESDEDSEETSVIVQLTNRVQDGTRCRPGSLDMCIQGKCQVSS